MVIFNSKEAERTQQQKLHCDVSSYCERCAVFLWRHRPVWFTGPGPGEGRKGKGSLMRVEKSEGGRKRLVWTRTVRTSPTGKRKEAGVGWGEIGKWKQGYRQAQGAGHQQSVENQFCDRNISKASRVTQTQNQVQRQDSSSQPELHLSGCGTALLGLWERRLLAGLRG